VDQIKGLGAGSVTPAVSTIIEAGDGNDTFDFNKHKFASSVTIYGGGGDDVLNFGDGNLSANIANLSTFLFDGQGGENRFNLLDANGDIGSYARNIGTVSYTNSAGTVTLSETNTRLMNIYPSADAPSVSMVGVAPETTTAVHFNTPVNLGLLQ